jgi:hypothetical protein
VKFSVHARICQDRNAIFAKEEPNQGIGIVFAYTNSQFKRLKLGMQDLVRTKNW